MTVNNNDIDMEEVITLKQLSNVQNWIGKGVRIAFCLDEDSSVVYKIDIVNFKQIKEQIFNLEKFRVFRIDSLDDLICVYVIEIAEKGVEEMTRELLLQYICPTTCTKDCSPLGRNNDDSCDYCDVKLSELLDEYDKHVIEQYKADTGINDTIREIHDNVAKEMYCKGIDDFANYLVEQGILGNRCISDGEITDYGKVYAKKYKEQLKVGEVNE